MALPINIEEMINGKTVEWERIEFRKGWNPERIIRTICAFSNDFNNWGGGYLVIGVDESDGRPVLPPEGLEINQIDSIQKELNHLCRKILPNYFPIVEPMDFQRKKILVLWCPGGSNRPYKAPDSLGDNPRYFYYIRRFSSTVQPTREEEKEEIWEQVRVQVGVQANFFIINNLDEILATYTAFGEQVREQVREQVTSRVPIKKIHNLMNILRLCQKPQTRKSILESFGLTNLYKNYESHIVKLIEYNLLTRTIPDKPKSSKQKYKTTGIGDRLLEILS
jgi:ATP-dependent DNA helicase RecG